MGLMRPEDVNDPPASAIVKHLDAVDTPVKGLIIIGTSLGFIGAKYMHHRAIFFCVRMIGYIQ